jgi:hypothetical protein
MSNYTQAPPGGQPRSLRSQAEKLGDASRRMPPDEELTGFPPTRDVAATASSEQVSQAERSPAGDKQPFGKIK